VVLEHKQHIRRLSLATTASAVVVGHLQLQVDTISADFASVYTRLADAVKACEDKDMTLEELHVKLDTTVRDLEVVKTQRSELLDLLESNVHTSTHEAERLETAYQETKDALDQAEAQLSYLTQSYEEVESQRNSLHLQVTNLQSDLDQAQQ
jgi:chromosome segregation ATPase